MNNYNLSPGAIAQLSAILMGSPTRGGQQQAYSYPQPRAPRAQPRSGMRLEDVAPQVPAQGPVPNFMPGSGPQAQSPYPESGTPQLPIFAQNPFPESGTQLPGGTPPYAPPDVAASTRPQASTMPLVPPGGLPPSQPAPMGMEGIAPASMEMQGQKPFVSDADLIEQWRRMMDQQQFLRQGG